MIEILNIFSSFTFLLLISLFPVKLNFKKNKNILTIYTLFDYLFLNLIINISLILLISFLNIDYFLYFISLIIFSLVFNIHNFFKNKNYLNFIFNKIFVFFLFINIILAVYLISNPILAWDGLENWYFKSQNFFYNYNFFDLSELKGNNNYYPHLGTLIWGFFWKNSFIQNEYLGRLFFIFIYSLSIFSICELINKNNIYKVIILSLIILLSFDDFLFRGYQEILIFSLLIFTIKNFYFYLKNNNSVYLLICFLSLNLIPWVKHEGFLFVLVLSFSMLLILNYFQNKKLIFNFIILTWFLIIIKNFIFYKYLNLNFVHGGGFNLFKESKSIFEFTYIFSKGLVVSIIKYKIWIFILIAIYSLSKIKTLNKVEKMFLKFLNINLLFFSLLLVGIYYNLYINSGLEFSWWVDTSLDRLIYSVSGIFIISIMIITKFIKNYSLK